MSADSIKCPHCGEDLEVEKVAERVADAHARLGSLLQILSDKPLPGGMLVGHPEQRSDTRAAAFALLVEKHHGGEALMQALRDAGFQLLELPESVYGAFSPSELL